MWNDSRWKQSVSEQVHHVGTEMMTSDSEQMPSFQPTEVNKSLPVRFIHVWWWFSKDLDIISATSWEWPFATKMACKVSTPEDLTAGSEESLSPRQTEWRPESAEAVEWDLLGTGPEVPGTSKLLQDLRDHLERWKRIQEAPPIVLGHRHGYGNANLMRRLLANVANRSTCGSSHLANTGRRRSMAIVHSVFSVCPTLDSESTWTLCTPGGRNQF